MDNPQKTETISLSDEELGTFMDHLAYHYDLGTESLNLTDIAIQTGISKRQLCEFIRDHGTPFYYPHYELPDFPELDAWLLQPKGSYFMDMEQLLHATKTNRNEKDNG